MTCWGRDLLSQERNLPKRPLVVCAANAGSEPDPDIVILCWMRTQRGECGMSEKLHAAPPQTKRPSEQMLCSPGRRGADVWAIRARLARAGSLGDLAHSN